MKWMLNFNWSWQQVVVFALLLATALTLVLTHHVEWKALVTFAVGILFRNPMYISKPEDTDEAHTRTIDVE
jgi:hypothetical protein